MNSKTTFTVHTFANGRSVVRILLNDSITLWESASHDDFERAKRLCEQMYYDNRVVLQVPDAPAPGAVSSGNIPEVIYGYDVAVSPELRPSDIPIYGNIRIIMSEIINNAIKATNTIGPKGGNGGS